MPYIISFSISLLILFFAERTKKRGRYYIGFIAIMIPCFLAAFRADTIGTDVRTYLIPMFNIAQNSDNIKDFFSGSWMQLYTLRTVASIEFGFSLLVYIVTKIFSNLYVLQFFVQFFAIVPIWIALNKVSFYLNKKVVVVGMMVYYAMCYNYSLNLMRQYIATGFMILAFSYLVMNNRKKFFICQLIGVTFHYAAIVGFFLYIIYEFILGRFIPYSTRINEFMAARKRAIIVIALSIFTVITLPLLVDIITKVFGNVKYIGYINGGIGFSVAQIILRLPLLIVLIINFKRLQNDYGNKIWVMLTFIVLIMVVAQLVNSDGTASSNGAYRIVLFFSSFLVLIIPYIYVAFASKKSVIFRIALMSYLVIWWIYYFGVAEECTVPYLSIWN